MPRGGSNVTYRGKQLALLSGLIHERVTDPRIDTWLNLCESDEALAADRYNPAAVNVREWRRGYERSTKLPAALVREFAETTTLAKSAWAEARGKNEFAHFQPWLEKLIALNQQRARCWGWPDEGEIWDALADGYEVGLNAAEVGRVFAPLRTDLTDLVAQISERRGPTDRFIRLKLPIDLQRSFVTSIVQEIGFDFTRGRLDLAVHPFCSSPYRDDVRMTTRFHEDNFPDALGSTMHESGHGIYEQNLPAGDFVNTPFGHAVGLSIHESQSRLIECQLGRSEAFWQWCYPKLRDHFGAHLNGLSLADCYAGINYVEPGLIRVEADEATYNLHIMIRFELERALLKGDLSVADLPGAWNEKYASYLGVEVPDDARGCLQDIHWSMGAMGYFPTYTLGNLYAAQFMAAAKTQINDLDGSISRGEFLPLINWLKKNIHDQGRRYTTAELGEKITGGPLKARPFLAYLESKLGPLYGLN